jgi:hypothetical protein
VFYLSYLNVWIWFEFKKELAFEFKFEIWIKPNWQKPIRPIWPTGPTSPLGLGLADPARVWVNRPSPATHSLTYLFPDNPSGDLDRRRHRLVIPASSSDLRRCHLGRNTRRCAFFNLHQIVSPAASSLRRSVAGSRSGFHPSATTGLQSSPASLSNASGISPRETWCGCTPVEVPDAVLPVVPR